MRKTWIYFWKDTLFLVCLLLALGSAGGFETGAFSLGRWIAYTVGFVLLAGCCLLSNPGQKQPRRARNVVPLSGKHTPHRPTAA